LAKPLQNFQIRKYNNFEFLVFCTNDTYFMLFSL
jgi:hypothetical protein